MCTTGAGLHLMGRLLAVPVKDRPQCLESELEGDSALSRARYHGDSSFLISSLWRSFPGGVGVGESCSGFRVSNCL